MTGRCDPDLILALTERLGPNHVLEGDDVGGRHDTDWSGMAAHRPCAVVRPGDHDAVRFVIDACRKFGQPIVVQGGMSGVVGGAVSRPGELALSLERMSRIDSVDVTGRVVIAEAGVTIEAVQTACEAAKLMFPLDLGSRGSATVGGVIATNAGGNRVLRYGMTRSLVLGLDAVMADGRDVRGIRTMLKDNSGYDLKQLLIGTEGTLGVVTRAAFRLWPMPAERQVAFCRVPDFQAAIELFARLERDAGPLTAFEAMWPDFYDLVLDYGGGLRAPFADRQYPGLYLLAEQFGGGSDLFEQAIASAIDDKVVDDAVIAQSENDARSLWAIRDAIGPASSAMKPFLSYDVGFSIAGIEPFVKRAREQLSHLSLPMLPAFFGHLGDGNIHVLIAIGQGGDALKDQCDAAIYNATRAFGGTISAEHGIGRVKTGYLGHTRTPEEIAMMRQLKTAFDSRNLLNPDRVVSIDTQ